MDIRLSRSEFITLAALLKAEGIFGLDPAQLMPAASTERQALYNAGEKSLQSRDLLRVTEKSEAVLEQNLLRISRAVVDPQTTVRIIKTLPAAGQQVYLHYGREAAFVEQTMPDEQTHRLSDIGGIGELLQRIQAILPVPAGSTSATTISTYDARLLIAVYGLFQQNGVKDARDALRDNNALDATTEAWLGTLSNLDYSGTLALFKIIPDAEVTPAEIAVFVGAGVAWLLTPAANEKVQLAKVDGAAFATFVGRLLATVA
jgi:hypothetical protein